MPRLELPAWAVVSPRRAEHIGRVVVLLDSWAKARGVPAAEAARWRRAALLHDALKEADPDTLAEYVVQGDWPRALWHGPAAAAAAARHGEKDQGVLDAVRYHSVGYAGWDDAGKALYLADYLEPGRDRADAISAAQRARVPLELEQVLFEVAGARIAHLRESGKTVGKETQDFWNRLVRDASSSS
jgi:HD superfamily phosphohydrolase YqeK